MFILEQWNFQKLKKEQVALVKKYVKEGELSALKELIVKNGVAPTQLCGHCGQTETEIELWVSYAIDEGII